MKKLNTCKKLISSVLIFTLLNLFGCYSFEAFSVPEYKQVEEEESKPDEIYVTTKDSQEYHFLYSDYDIVNDTLYGKTEMIVTDMEKPFEGKFALSEIKYIQFLASNGSYSIVSVSEYLKIEAESGKPDEIDITKYDYTRYHFMKDDYSIENDTLYGKGKLLSGDRAIPINKKIALSDIESFQLERFNWLYTSLLLAGILAPIVYLIIKSGNFGGGMGDGFIWVGGHG